MTTRITVEAEGFDDISQNYGEARVRVLGALNRALRSIGRTVTPALKDNTPVRTGRLRNSTRFQVLGQSEDQRLEIRQGARTEQGVFYRPFVTGGTAPHEIVPVTKKALRFMVNGTPVFAKRVRHPGTKANPYHVRTVREQMPAIRGILKEEAVGVTVELSR